MSVLMEPGTTDPDAAARLHRPALVTFAFRFLRNADEAEEVVQAALMRAVEAVHEGTRPENVRAWLYKIVLREAQRLLDRSRVRREATYVPPTQGPSNEDRIRRVLAAIDALEEPARRVMLLRFAQHLSFEETAEALDMPIGTVKSHQSRAVRILRERLGAAL